MVALFPIPGKQAASVSVASAYLPSPSSHAGDWELSWRCRRPWRASASKRLAPSSRVKTSAPSSCRSPPPAVLLSLCGGPRAAAPGYRFPVRSALLNVQFREFNKCIERAVQPFSQSSPQLLPLPQQTPCFQPQPQATTDLPVSMNLSFKDISCNWNHIVSALVSHPFYRSVCE